MSRKFNSKSILETNILCFDFRIDFEDPSVFCDTIHLRFFFLNLRIFSRREAQEAAERKNDCEETFIFMVPFFGGGLNLFAAILKNQVIFDDRQFQLSSDFAE